jgi:hypothetical protein
MERSVVIRVLKPGLPAIGIRHPAQQVIEAAVLHHHNDNVLDAGKIRARERCIELLDLFCLCKGNGARKRRAGNTGHAAQKVSAIHTPGGCSRGRWHARRQAPFFIGAPSQPIHECP